MGKSLDSRERTEQRVNHNNLFCPIALSASEPPTPSVGFSTCKKTPTSKVGDELRPSPAIGKGKELCYPMGSRVKGKKVRKWQAKPINTGYTQRMRDRVKFPGWCHKQ